VPSNPVKLQNSFLSHVIFNVPKKGFIDTYSLLPARLKYNDLTHSCGCNSILMIDEAVQLCRHLLVLNETVDKFGISKQMSTTNVKQIQKLLNTLYQLMHI
jgi:hypothetical protein